MGKSKHESFIEKSNFRVIRQKLGEDNVGRKLGSDKEIESGAKNCEKEEKERKRFWKKLLSFVRRHSSSHKNKTTEMVIADSLNTYNNEKAPSAFDVIGIPTEPEKKFSKIFVRPSKTGLDAVISQYCGSSFIPEKSADDTKAQIVKFARSRTITTEDDNRLSWSMEVAEDQAKTLQNNEIVPTSALFVHQNMDKLVESAVFIEPNLIKDYPDLKKSEEMSQKSIKMNRRKLNYKVAEEKNCVKTFKTVSEPSWNERRKIFQQQRLHENINNLLEQFMFLEAEDIFDLSLSQNKLTERKKITEVENSFPFEANEILCKELSREVSPEILVNIKPFKEFVSNEYTNIQGASTKLVLNKENNQGEEKKNTSNTMPVNSKILTESNNKVTEKFTVFHKVNDSVPNNKSAIKDEKEFHDAIGSILSLSSDTEKEIKTTCYDDFSDVISISFNDDLPPEALTCSLWGIYKSYSKSRNVYEEEGKKVTQEEKLEKDVENIRENEKAFDEFLNNLDEGRHDSVFQKNISQFKKKIIVMPHSDYKKSSSVSSKPYQVKQAQKKLRETGNALIVKKPVVRGTSKMTRGSSKSEDEKIVERFRLECLELWNERRKPERVLENISLLLYEAKLYCRTVATRMEMSTISFPEHFKEVYDLLENNTSALVELKNPTCAVECLKTLMKINRAFPWPDYRQNPEILYSKDVRVVESLDEFESMATQLFSQTFQSLDFVRDDTQHQISDESHALTESVTKEFQETLNEMESENLQKIELQRQINFIKYSETVYDLICRVVQILNDVSCDYIVRIYDTAIVPSNSSSKSHSEPDVPRKSIAYSKPSLDPALLDTINKHQIKVPEIQTRSNLNFRVDGFQILYNNTKDDPNDEEDEAEKTTSATRINGKKHRTASIESEKTLKRVEECLMEEIPERLEKKLSKILKHKSNSSPRENIIRTEFAFQENRTRRSLNLSKELCKDHHGCRKKMFSIDVGEIRRTGSTFLEARQKVRTEKPFFRQNSNIGITEALRNLSRPPAVVEHLQGTESKGFERQKTFVLEKTGTRVRKEVAAAFNSIKELSSWNGEVGRRNKRMSLVILFSKK